MYTTPTQSRAHTDGEPVTATVVVFTPGNNYCYKGRAQRDCRKSCQNERAGRVEIIVSALYGPKTAISRTCARRTAGRSNKK